METEDDKHKRWKTTEQHNAKQAMRKMVAPLHELGLMRVRGSVYEVEIRGIRCRIGVSKLSLSPSLRVYASWDDTPVLTSDHYTRRGNESGTQFKLDASRFADNSDFLAREVVRYVKTIALPWLEQQVAQQGHAGDARNARA